MTNQLGPLLVLRLRLGLGQGFQVSPLNSWILGLVWLSSSDEGWGFLRMSRAGHEDT